MCTLHGALLISSHLVDSEQKLFLPNKLPLHSSIDSLYDIWRLYFMVNLTDVGIDQAPLPPRKRAANSGTVPLS